ncbi:hypothetical protein OS493_014548 [Desmophyllum pertusum]|uniref:Fucolectin tachylectin-4 pentraxin-1 domain-containing protein n=1 Tax=Desmophyllum pertusum TaxID=174260 RepID=A0A9W9YPZ5_9CNID|nr:hypothetical protein OS493_014548 [Desmophyllum pertusum]
MAARSDQIKNYCNNIKVYHEKKEEEQFYDFTIKDQDGNNVQDVLMFADYINLTDVTEICTNYIIKNIDLSNYAHVIQLGNTQGMVKLVEAGVLFAARNMSRQNIICLDEFSKAMIIKVATWQQKQVTVMTGEMACNRLKTYFLSSPEDKVAFQVRCSSVYQDRPVFSPKFAINGNISDHNTDFSTLIPRGHPWLEVKLPSPVVISSVTIVNRQNSCRERLRNVEIRAGMEPVPEGFTLQERGHNGSKKLEVNSRCGFFAGPADRFIMEGHVITFDQPTLAQYITLQILEVEYLQINGIKINGGDLLNYEDYF